MVFTGELPQTADILNTNKFAMFGLGYAMQAILGVTTLVDGCACLPTSPTADLNVNIQVGSIYSLTTVDSTAYSDLGTDTSSIVKQGIQPSVQVLAITPPGTVGQSQVYLVQAEYQDVDTGGAVEPYYNSGNPAAPFSGPNNAGTSNNTIRQGKCTISLKAGVAAATGSQTTPAPDAGFVGLWAVTVANGQTQITSPNIVAYNNGAAFIPVRLPAVPAGVQNGTWIYAIDTSAGGAAVVTTATTSTSSAVLTFAGGVPAYVATGMKAFDITTPGAITGGQTVLSKTGTTVTLSGNVNATVGSGDSIAFSTNAMVASIAPPPASLTAGLGVRIQAAGTNSGTTTLNLNGLGAVNIVRANGVSTAAGDISANEIVNLIYDGAHWQIANFSGSGSGAVTNNTIAIPYGTDSSTSSNTITVTSTSPSLPGSIGTGQPLMVKLANPVTGATTIALTGVTGSPFPVKSFTGAALTFGSASAGEMLWMLFDGTNFQIINPPQPLQTNLTIYVNSSTGSDSLDGSQATVSGTKGPLQHLQTAINKAFNYPPSQFAITIQLADGTYAEAVSTPSIPGPAIIINGNAGSPSNVLVSGNNSTHTIIVTGPNTMTVQNLKVTTGTFTTACGFAAIGSGATINTINTVSGSVRFAVHFAQLNGNISIANHTYSGNSTFAVYCIDNATCYYAPNAVLTISTPITLTAWLQVQYGGNTGINNPGIPTFVNPGNVTGTKFIASTNGTINAQGQGINFFPGTVAGTQDHGGQYL
jgi:hypothetical protein